MILFRICLALALVCVIKSSADWSQDENAEKWRTYSKLKLQQSLNRKLNGNVAKNIIFFLGDGMGIPTVTAGRILKGQVKNGNGEEEVEFLLLFNFIQSSKVFQFSRLTKITYMERLNHVALSKTYNIDAQTPDSAGTATAYLTGVKTRIGVIGLDGRAVNCSTSEGTELESILDWAHFAGKSTGIVTTTRITHATPAGAYGHVYNRDWEAYDNDKYKNDTFEEGCRDLAVQLVEDNSFINLIFGGGRRKFLRTNDIDYQLPNKNGDRVDDRNLINEWQNKMQTKKLKHKFLWNRADFDKLQPNKYDHILGLFNFDHMEYEIDRIDNKVDEPTIANMTTKAIKLLSSNPNGFFLLVEGGRIDHGHHESKAKKALYDFVAFDDAIGAALDMIDLDETLVVVTADHSHTFSMGGYANRGNPLFDTVRSREGSLTSDKLTFTALLYANGPGFKNPVRQVNLTDQETSDKNYRQESAIPLSDETHGGDDVAIFASGPMSYLFDGTVEQSHIAHVMAYSACIGPYNQTNFKNCKENRGVLFKSSSMSSFSFYPVSLISIGLLICALILN